MPLDPSLISNIRAPRLMDLADAYSQGQDSRRRSTLADLQAEQIRTTSANEAEDRAASKVAGAKDAKRKDETYQAEQGRAILAEKLPYLRAIPDPAMRSQLLKASLAKKGLDTSEVEAALPDDHLDALEQSLLSPKDRAELTSKAKTSAEKAAADTAEAARKDKDSAFNQGPKFTEEQQHNRAMEKAAWASATKPPAGAADPNSVAIPGLSAVPGVQITKDSVKNVKIGAEAYDTVKEQIGRIRDLYAKTGTEMGGENARRLASMVRQLQLTLKGPAFLQLGVLTGPDMSLLDEMVPNPTGISENMKAMIPGMGDPVSPKLDELENFIEGRYNSALQRNGFQRAAVPGKQTSSAQVAAVKVGTKAERDQLPPGTRYIGPDGKEYVKK